MLKEKNTKSELFDLERWKETGEGDIVVELARVQNLYINAVLQKGNEINKLKEKMDKLEGSYLLALESYRDYKTLHQRLRNDAKFRDMVQRAFPTCHECTHYQQGYSHALGGGWSINCKLLHRYDSYNDTACKDFKEKK